MQLSDVYADSVGSSSCFDRDGRYLCHAWQFWLTGSHIWQRQANICSTQRWFCSEACCRNWYSKCAACMRPLKCVWCSFLHFHDSPHAIPEHWPAVNRDMFSISPVSVSDVESSKTSAICPSSKNTLWKLVLQGAKKDLRDLHHEGEFKCSEQPRKRREK